MRAYLRQLPAAIRLLLVLTVLLGVIYPLAISAVAQIPGLKSHANGSALSENGQVVGSSLLGQSFTDSKGKPLPQYFQTRPSASDYDPTATGASNLGPESIVDSASSPSLLTQVCGRSLAIGTEFGVSGARPFCTSTGVGAVLGVFYTGPGYHGSITRVVSLDQFCPAVPFLASYHGVAVMCASKTGSYAAGQVVPIRGTAPAHSAVPADAVTGSGSGLDPDISPAYAHLQEATVAKARGISVSTVATLVARYTSSRDLGFLGEPRVNAVELNLALDKEHPLR